MKTVKVRIAVAVDPDGSWRGRGSSDASARDSLTAARAFSDSDAAVYWITAELPVPEAQEIAATVEEAKT